MFLVDVIENRVLSLSPRDVSFEEWQLILLEASTKSSLKWHLLKRGCSLFLYKLSSRNLCSMMIVGKISYYFPTFHFDCCLELSTTHCLHVCFLVYSE